MKKSLLRYTSICEHLEHLPEPKHLAEVTDADERSDNPVLDLTGDRFEYTSYSRSYLQMSWNGSVPEGKWQE